MILIATMKPISSEISQIEKAAQAIQYYTYYILYTQVSFSALKSFKFIQNDLPDFQSHALAENSTLPDPWGRCVVVQN